MTSLPATQDAAARAIAFAWLFAERSGLGEAATERLVIVVEEWMLNVLEHGGAPCDSLIVLQLERLDDRLRMTVSDAGAPFDPRLNEFSGPNLERGGGAGLALIAAWTRIEDYQRRDGRNHLVMELQAN